MTFFPKGRMGCANCRSRRIKCNELRPACSQCERAGLVCSGYRTQIDLMFVDQTEKVLRRPLARQAGKDVSKARSMVSATCNSIFASRSVPSYQNVRSQPSPPPALSVPIESAAQAFFFNKYAIVGSTCPYSTLRNSRGSPASLVSITAVGMAGLATFKQDSHLMVLARIKYQSSIRLIKKFLRNPHDVLKERTAAAVFMMAMFEMITCEDYRSMGSWISHIQGFTALTEIRNTEIWNTTTNVQGFLQVYYIGAMGCLINNTVISTHIAELVRSSRIFQSGVELLPASELFHIVNKLSQLRASATIHDAPSLIDIISKAIGIENQLKLWASELPSMWRYRTVEWKTEDIFHGRSYHIYQNSWHACVWNYYRICRVLLHVVLLNNLNMLESTVSLGYPALASAYQLQRAESQSVLSIVPSQIQASIPYQLGLFNAANSDTTSIPKPSAVFSLLGVLQVFISSTNTSLVTIDWIPKILEFIGHNFGIKQASIMARWLDEGLSRVANV